MAPTHKNRWSVTTYTRRLVLCFAAFCSFSQALADFVSCEFDITNTGPNQKTYYAIIPDLTVMINLGSCESNEPCFLVTEETEAHRLYSVIGVDSVTGLASNVGTVFTASETFNLFIMNDTGGSVPTTEIGWLRSIAEAEGATRQTVQSLLLLTDEVRELVTSAMSGVFLMFGAFLWHVMVRKVKP